MAKQSDHDSWAAGQSYEHYMGRWSRKIASAFLTWLSPPPDAHWLEVGCGTGALSQTILQETSPGSLVAVDQSADFVAYARDRTDDKRAQFAVADAMQLPCSDGSVDVVASALVLNFIPDKPKALGEMCRVLRPGGLLSFYVWDYPGGGMGFIDAFWKAASEIDPKAIELNESGRFPFCTPQGLMDLCADSGVQNAEVVPIEIKSIFDDFEAFWHPFTLGAGPAPGYCRSLSEEDREQLKERLNHQLGDDGPISLPARAWAVRATMPA